MQGGWTLYQTLHKHGTAFFFSILVVQCGVPLGREEVKKIDFFYN
jgi:hypothetical protein